MTDENTKECPFCGETIKKNATVCRFCNKDLVASQQAQEEAKEKVLFEGHPAVIYSVGQWVVGIITLGLGFIRYWLVSISTKYSITTQRIIIEKGILSKKKDIIEVFRVDDFETTHPFGMRMLGYGILSIKSSDRSIPSKDLLGLKNISDLYEQLRECNLRERKRRGITTFAHS